MQKPHPNNENVFNTSGIKEGDNDQEEVNDLQMVMPEQLDYNDEIVHNSTHEKKKKKRKRKQVNDLRFEEAKETLGIGSKRKERKKK